MNRRLPFALLLLLAACKTESSDEYETNQIKAHYSVNITDDAKDPTRDSVQLAAQFSRNLATDIRLADGDRASVRSEKDADIPLSLGELNVYAAYPDAWGDRTTATFGLHRAVGASAPASTIAIPARLAFTTPENATVAYAAGAGTLDLTWSNAVAGAKVRINIDPCDGISTLDIAELPDTGKITIATNQMTVGAPTASTCLELLVHRVVEGTVDPALAAGSTMKVDRTDVLKITLTPDPT